MEPPHPSWQASTRARPRLADLRPGLSLLRRHWLFALVFTAGIGLRVITQLAYQPLLIFYDSPSYLGNAADLRPAGFRPVGYPVFLAPLVRVGNLAAIPITQHVLVLAIAALLYLTLLRIGLWPWLAALGPTAVLLDGFQLNLEQWAMPDPLFQVLLVVAFCALVWNRPPTWLGCAVCGTALALAVAVRFAGALMIVPALMYAVFAATGWTQRLRRALAMCVAFAVPLVGYASWFDAANGHFGLPGSSGILIYARAASFVDCAAIDLPDYEKPLCPTEPVDARMPTNDFAWDPKSPAADYEPPAGMNKRAVFADFARRAFLAQPLGYTRAVFGDFLHGLQWQRSNRRQDIQEEYWRFTTSMPPYPSANAAPQLTARFGGGPPAVQRELAGFLRDYQIIAYTRGPFLALALLIALLGGFGAGRARRSGVRAVALFWAAGGLCVTLFAYAGSEFTWRYQMPALVFYPIAGAVGLFALLGGTRPGPDGARIRTGAASAAAATPAEAASTL